MIKIGNKIPDIYIGSKQVYGKNLAYRLPILDGYDICEYIESNGAQYIDTGLKLISTSKVVFDIDNLDIGEQGINASFDFGSRNGYRNAMSYIGIWNNYSNGSTTFLATLRIGNSEKDITSNFYNIGRHTYTFDIANKSFSDGEHIVTTTNAFIANDYNATIFMANNGGSVINVESYTKLYNFKMYEGTTLVRNFLPAKRKSDNEVGLYDLVNNVFYTNQGTGTFTAGPEIKQVEYIELSGTQYIDSGIKYDSNNKYQFDTKINVTAQNSNTYSGWDAGGLYGIYRSQGYYTDGGDDVESHVVIDGIDTIIQQIIYAGTSSDTVSNLTVNNTNYTYSRKHSRLSTGASTTGYPIGRRYSQTRYKEGLVGKIYYFKITLNDVLTRDLIPVKINNEYCMYDLVEHKIYRNAGTGSFTGGSELQPLIRNIYIGMGKNMFDKETIDANWVIGKRKDDSGNEVNDEDSTYSSFFIKVKPNTNYVLSYDGTVRAIQQIYQYTKDKVFINRINIQTSSTTKFTTSSNCEYIQIQKYNTDYTNVSNVQLEEGSNATEYQPYGPQKL